MSDNRTTGNSTSPPVAVIDIGATFIRILIAEKRSDGGIGILERAVQSVAIGRDIVTARKITNPTVERCVEILKSFHRLLDEYGIDNASVTAVATAMVKLADNSEVFLDRISNTSHFFFRLLDLGQVGYYYHLAFRAIRDKRNNWEKGEAVVLEIGGLTCGMLCRNAGEIRFVQTYTVGSLHLRRQMEEAALMPRQITELAEGKTHEIAFQIRQNLESPKSVKLLLMGHEMRCAAARMLATNRLKPQPDTNITTLSVDVLEKLLNEVGAATTEEIVREWNISYTDAELLGPSLSIAVSVARALDLNKVYISSLSFSNGLLEEAVAGSVWSTAMRKHVLRVARETGEKYQYDQNHAEQVARIALDLFDLLQDEHGCSSRHRLFLEVAALLHDIGVFVSVHSHNKHTMYLVRNTEFAGLSSQEIELIAVVTRYHRKAIPKSNHLEYTSLRPDDRLVVSKLAAILRVADALDRVHDQSLGKIRFQLTDDTLVCIPSQKVVTSAEVVSLAEKGDLFELMFGRRCHLHNPD
jgi:exopolyphosphatase/guanosine-5'-triphosphate,3'-diphosphate pyrophosphatase